MQLKICQQREMNHHLLLSVLPVVILRMLQDISRSANCRRRRISNTSVRLPHLLRKHQLQHLCKKCAGTQSNCLIILIKQLNEHQRKCLELVKREMQFRIRKGGKTQAGCRRRRVKKSSGGLNKRVKNTNF